MAACGYDHTLCGLPCHSFAKFKPQSNCEDPEPWPRENVQTLPLPYAFPHSAFPCPRMPVFPRRFVVAVQCLMGAASLLSSSSSFLTSARSRSSEAEEILRNVKWPGECPFKQSDFRCYDE